jgi:hypothetical protein
LPFSYTALLRVQQNEARTLLTAMGQIRLFPIPKSGLTLVLRQKWSDPGCRAKVV